MSEYYATNENSALIVTGDNNSYTFKPPLAGICPKHGEQRETVTVTMGTEHDGKYCMLCWVENVIVPNCSLLAKL